MNSESSTPITRCPLCQAVLLRRGPLPIPDKCPFCILKPDSEKVMAAAGCFEVQRKHRA